MGETTNAIVSAFQAGFTQVSSDVMGILGVAIPIAIGVAGTLFIARRAMGWFKGMAK